MSKWTMPKPSPKLDYINALKARARSKERNDATKRLKGSFPEDID